MSRRAPPVKRGPNRRGAGGVIIKSDEEIIAEKIAAFEMWVDNFIEENGFQNLSPSTSSILTEEEKHELARKEVLDEITLKQTSVHEAAREWRDLSSVSSAVDHKFERIVGTCGQII